MRTQHYDAAYFDWQRPIGEFGEWLNLTKFSPYISESDDVLDFGCGGASRSRTFGVGSGSASRSIRMPGKLPWRTASSALRARTKSRTTTPRVIIEAMPESTDVHPLAELRALYNKLQQYDC